MRQFTIVKRDIKDKVVSRYCFKNCEVNGN